jgi:hypothetical protein
MSARLPKLNDVIAYRAWAGDVWSAVVTDVIAGETFAFVDVDVLLPGDERLHLRAVRWWGDEDPERRGAGWPKREDAR